MPRILRIIRVDGFRIICRFNTGEYRVIDFEQLFQKWDVQQGDIEYPLLNSENFKQVIVNDSQTLAWPNIKVSYSSFENPNEIIDTCFDLSPDVLYEASKPLEVHGNTPGSFVRYVRKKLHMTQDELAKRAGTTKPYISRLENDKSTLEIDTLEKIVEEGFGGVIQIKIFVPKGNNESETFETILGNAEYHDDAHMSPVEV